jgi:2,4-dienoyl-CoA reductase-like NADH-dependent reductase (Old Yellow Enzyme family)
MAVQTAPSARRQIFERSRLAGLELPNRLVRSATWEGMATHEGTVTDRLVTLYGELAAGGIGLIISSYLTVHPQGRQHVDQIGAHDDEHLEGLSRIATKVHEQGGRIVGQLVHCGGQSTRQAMGGLDPLAPSAVSSPGYPEVPQELTATQIEEVVGAFARAARRLHQAGFDGAQLHGAHGYLLAEFLSPSRNQRADRYGGSLENRARFGVEIYQAVRAAVGPAYPVLIKLNAHDFMEGSTTEQDSTFFARQLADAGIDAIEVSGGTPGSGKLGAARAGITGPADEAYFLPQARALRAAVPDTPLILVGGIRSLDTMERILAEGVVDYFAMSRPLIREPDLPLRWERGDRSPAHCVSCLSCFGPARRGEGIRCVDKEKATSR